MNLDNLMSEVGLLKKSPLREKIQEGPENDYSTAIYIDKIIIKKARQWLETEDFSLEDIICHYLGTETARKEREHRIALKEAVIKEKNDTIFSMEQCLHFHQEEKNFWKNIYK